MHEVVIYDADSDEYQQGLGCPIKCAVDGCPDDEDMGYHNGYCTAHIDEDGANDA